MEPLSALIHRVAQPGRVVWIGVRPGRRDPMTFLHTAHIGEGGLTEDRAKPGKRAVTLVQAEHLSAIGSYLGRGPVSPEDLRRNLVVEGINLAGLKGRRLRLGGAVLEITGICAPCSRMEDALGPGGYAAVRGHGGWCAKVVQTGQVALGDRIMPADEGLPQSRSVPE